MIMLGRALVLMAMLLSATGPAWSSAEAGGTAGQASAAERDGEAIPEAVELAPVAVDGKALFSLRGIRGFTARARADAVAERIVAIARDKSIAADAVGLQDRPVGTTIVAGDRPVMTMLEADARVEGIELPVLAQVYLRQVSLAVAAYRADREPRALARGAAYAGTVLAVLAVGLFVLLRLRRRVDAALERRYRARLDQLRIAGFKPLNAERMWGALGGVVAAAFGALALIGTYAALNFALMQFPATRGFAMGLLELVVEPLRSMGHGVASSIPGLVFLFILVLVVRYILQSLRLLFGAIEHGSVQMKGFYREWSWPTYRIVRLLVIAFAVVVGFPYIPGSSSEAFKGVSLLLGIMFSLGSTSFIANIIAGYEMTYRRAFRVGDRIKVGDVVGDVTEVRLQVTHVRTVKNEDVVVPNSVILGNSVVNYSTLAASQGLILHTTVGIGYETPWRQVEAMLLMAAERTSRLKKEPVPFVLQKSLGDFAITYELNAYCDRPNEMNAIYTELHRNILDTFNEFGVAIMTPAYEGDPEQPKIVPKDQWYAAPARR
jgi:small-conductance mechanosensitive channel